MVTQVAASTHPVAAGNIGAHMLITTAEVAHRCNVSTSTVERWRRDPALGFPQPIKIGPKASRFDSVEVALWLESKRRRAEVAQ